MCALPDGGCSLRAFLLESWNSASYFVLLSLLGFLLRQSQPAVVPPCPKSDEQDRNMMAQLNDVRDRGCYAIPSFILQNPSWPAGGRSPASSWRSLRGWAADGHFGR
ncbi:hypothetical protein PG989_000513 [Apiospora arundinis]